MSSASSGANESIRPFDVPDFASLAPVREVTSGAHGGGAYVVKIAVSDVDAYRGDGELPVGFVACADHVVAATNAKGPLLCLRRDSPSAWSFGVATHGKWTREGTLDDCATCHATAPRPPVFGP